MERVLTGGPHSLNRKPVVVKQWHVGFDTNVEIFKSFPIWVQLKGLPVSFWSEDSLSTIRSVLGVPKYANECTTRVKRMEFVTVMIEVDATCELLQEVNIEGLGGIMLKQKVKYEFLPQFYRKCLDVGYVCAEKTMSKHRKVWVPKRRKTPPVNI